MAATGKRGSNVQRNLVSNVAASESSVPDALIKQARHSGQLNLSNRNLIEIPEKVWRINIDVPEDGKDVSLDSKSGDRWWEQTDLKKLLLASNQLKSISSNIANLSELNVLDLHDNRLDSLPDEVGHLLQLWKLNISHNKLSSVPESLAAVSSLKVLLLSYNLMEQIPDYFGNFVNLQELDVADNSISCLPESIGNLRSLRKLNLSNNRLTGLPNTIMHMNDLFDLCLRNNKLSALPSGLENMESMQILDCGGNVIEETVQLQGSNKIKELYLGNNRIKHFDPNSFQFLKSLVILDAKDNNIQSIPEEISLLSKLERLDIRNNNISRLPFVMGTMQLLKSILLDGNPLKGIRRDVISKGTQNILKYLRSRIETDEQKTDRAFTTSNMQQKEVNDNHIICSNEQDLHSIKLTRRIDYSNKTASAVPDDYFVQNVAVSAIDFSNNVLTQIPSKVTLYESSLTELKLRSNKLTDVPKELCLLLKLKHLDLGNNLLSSLPSDLVLLTSLIEVVLSGNKFQMIPDFLYEIESLEILLASSNQVTSIDVNGLLKLPQLAVLDLSNNSISTIPPELGTVSSLKTLNIEGNPFRNPRHAVLLKGTAYILQYLRDRIPR